MCLDSPNTQRRIWFIAACDETETGCRLAIAYAAVIIPMVTGFRIGLSYQHHLMHMCAPASIYNQVFGASINSRAITPAS